MRFVLLGSIRALSFACAVACSSSSSSGAAAPACDDTPVPTTAGATCSVAGKYRLESIPRCNQTRCSEDPDAPFEIEVKCTGNDCTIEGNRSTATSSTVFSVPCTLNGCECKYLGAKSYVFDANGFVGEGASLSNSTASDGGTCTELMYYRGTKQ